MTGLLPEQRTALLTVGCVLSLNPQEPCKGRRHSLVCRWGSPASESLLRATQLVRGQAGLQTTLSDSEECALAFIPNGAEFQISLKYSLLSLSLLFFLTVYKKEHLFKDLSAPYLRLGF